MMTLDNAQLIELRNKINTVKGRLGDDPHADPTKLEIKTEELEALLDGYLQGDEDAHTKGVGYDLAKEAYDILDDIIENSDDDVLYGEVEDRLENARAKVSDLMEELG